MKLLAPIKIVLLTALFTISLFKGLSCFALKTKSENINDPIVRSLYAYHQNSENHKSNNEPSLIITGSSIAADFGNIDGSVNLGIQGSLAFDINEKIVRRNCREQDTVLYFLSLSEFQNSSFFDANLIDNNIKLNLYLTRIILRTRLGLERAAVVGNPEMINRSLPRLFGDDLANYRKLLNENELNEFKARVTKAVLLEFSRLPVPDITEYQILAKDFQNLTYVLVPMRPTHETGERDIDGIIKNAGNLEKILEVKMNLAEVKHVNLEGHLSSDDYSDLIHLNVEGREKAITYLR